MAMKTSLQFVKCGQFFLESNSEGLYRSSGKEKESCCLVFPSSTKREIRHFHVVVVQRRQRNVQKSVMHVQSCCFANLTYLVAVVLFWHLGTRFSGRYRYRYRYCWEVVGVERFRQESMYGLSAGTKKVAVVKLNLHLLKGDQTIKELVKI